VLVGVGRSANPVFNDSSFDSSGVAVQPRRRTHHLHFAWRARLV